MQFHSRVAGIPCIIDVISIDLIKGDGFWAVSDEDSRDRFSAEFEVLDRRGRRAPWLERKLTAEIIDSIERQIGDRV